MICSHCAGGDHGKCKTNERWGQPTKTGLSPLARDSQRRTWCYCQHRGWNTKTPTLKLGTAAGIEDTNIVATTTVDGGVLTIKPYGIPPLPPESHV